MCGKLSCAMSWIWRALCNLALLLVLYSSLSAAAKNIPTLDPLTFKPSQVETPVLFTGLPAVLELPQNTFRSLFAKIDAGTKCDSFTLVPYIGPLHAVRVTASGLGLVDFSISNNSVPNQITISDLPTDGVTVKFCVHGDLIRQPASSVQGKLIAVAPGYKPTTSNVKLGRPSLAPWMSALQWFAAILLPAALAGIFGAGSAWVTSSLTQRRDQRTTFRKFKDDRWDDLGVFFQTHIRNVLGECKNELELAERLRLELQTRGYWTSIPWKERDQIEQFIKRKKASRMRSVLAILFWEWEKDLSELHK